MEGLLELLNKIDTSAFLSFAFFFPIIYAVIKMIIDSRKAKEVEVRVLDAEQKAFKTQPEEFVVKAKQLLDSRDRVEQQTQHLLEFLERTQSLLRMGVLFDLYNKQIEKYQTETRARAGWSFVFAIVAMFAGLTFVIWGGAFVFGGGGWQKVAAGSSISAIGGAVSAYITKTFLDVHRLSLLQLNRYFRQPVLNANILTAQRLADLLEPSDAKRQAYVNIINRVVQLIQEEDLSAALAATATPTAAPRRSRKSTDGAAHNKPMPSTGPSGG